MTAIEEQQPPTPVPAPARHRRRLALIGAAAAAAIATVLGFTLAGSTPAFAVTKNADGSVTLVLNDLRDPAGATRALQDAGVRAVVLPHAAPHGCAPGTTGVPADDAQQSLGMVHESPRGGGGALFAIEPKLIPAGDILVIGGSAPSDKNGQQWSIDLRLYKVPGPTCIEKLHTSG